MRPVVSFLIALLLCAAGLPANAAESFKNVDVVDAFVVTDDGQRLRTLTTRPKGATGRLPAVLFIQWLSCDTVELPAEGGDGWAAMLRGLIEDSGMVVMRTEKSGVGASSGIACDSLGYAAELAGHRAAFESLVRSEFVDPERVFVFGASMGGTMAPMVARGYNVRGILVWGTTTVTWLEHLLAMDRRVMQYRGVDAGELHAAMGAHARFHTLFLEGRKRPTQIVTDHPELADTWTRVIGSDGDRLYGRPAAFHQEAHAANWEAAWARVLAPVLVVNGEYDWIMTPAEHTRIVEIVNRGGVARATMVTLPKTDHHFSTFDSPADAFADRNGRPAKNPSRVFVDWLRKHR